MKLIHPELLFQIQFTDSQIPVCIVESPVRWRNMQRELCLQHQGEDGKWVLSEADQEIGICKSVELVLNPLQLEENQKKIMQTFLRSFCEKAVSDMYWKKSQELNAMIQSFFSDLEMEYPFEYLIRTEINFSSLAKAMEIQIESRYDSDLERLIQYCTLFQEMMQTKLFIFFHLHDYFSDQELALFYQEILSRKWNVLLMETSVRNECSLEKYYIVDEDECEIY